MIHLVAAMASNRVIGNNGEIPWHLPADLKYFKELTVNHAVIMGRKTFESILKRLGGPLPERLNVVVTRNPDYAIPYQNCVTMNSLEQAVSFFGDFDCYVIGGEEIYRQALPKADFLHLTLIDHDYSGDRYFPEIKPGFWQELYREPGFPDGKFPHRYWFITYRRNWGYER